MLLIVKLASISYEMLFILYHRVVTNCFMATKCIIIKISS